jgi:hypothetical protein
VVTLPTSGGRSRRTARVGARLPSLSVGLSESAEPPPICPREHLTADRRSGINRNRGVVARTLVGHLGGGLLTGFGLACSRIKAALCRACRLTSRYTVQPRRDPRGQVYPRSPGDDTVMTTEPWARKLQDGWCELAAGSARAAGAPSSHSGDGLWRRPTHWPNRIPQCPGRAAAQSPEPRDRWLSVAGSFSRPDPRPAACADAA